MSYLYRHECLTEQDTVRLASALARIAKMGDVFLLNGTLGMGKTVFSRAFIQELSGASEVPSPTFTLVQSYGSNSGEIYHFDLYRIKNPIEIFEIGIEEAIYGGISLIEWPEKMEGFRPRDVFEVTIMADKRDDKSRIIEIGVSSKEKEDRLKLLEI